MSKRSPLQPLKSSLNRSFVICQLSKLAIDDLVELESENNLSPWSEKHFQTEFAVSDSLVLGARRDGRLCGYIVLRAVLDEAHILNLYVAQSVRREGVATALLRTSFAYLERLGAVWCMLEVRRSNQAAKRLYSSLGFEQISVREKYYQRESEDALVLKVNLKDTKKR